LCTEWRIRSWLLGPAFTRLNTNRAAAHRNRRQIPETEVTLIE
jgi:hypothetical protein